LNDQKLDAEYFLVESANQTTEATQFNNYGHISGINNHTSGGSNSQYLNGGYAGMIGVAKSYKVFPGDQLQIEAYGSYNTPTANTSSLTGFAGVLISAFGLTTPAPGETGTAASALNTWGGIEAGGWGDGTNDNTDPKAFVNIVLFDKNFKFLDVAYAQLKGTSLYYMTASYTVKEAGYAYLYVSNEQTSMTDVYFDDVKISYTPSAIIQGNEYYPFGLQTANSWTRDGNIANNFLANGGTELNPTSGVYDLEFRNYDPVLSRLNQVDPLATNDVSLSPYHYSFNNPVRFIDPSGAWGDHGEVANPNPTYLHDQSSYGIGAYKKGNDPGGYGSSMTIAFTTIYSVTRGVKDENGNWIPEYTTQTYESETEYLEIRDFGIETDETMKDDPIAGKYWIDIYESNKSRSQAYAMMAQALLENGVKPFSRLIKEGRKELLTPQQNKIMDALGQVVKTGTRLAPLSKAMATEIGTELLGLAAFYDEVNESIIAPIILRTNPDWYSANISKLDLGGAFNGGGNNLDKW
jgi:RHS repeat-associated protein